MIFNFLKNKLSQKVNPATEETLLNIQSQTSLLTSDLTSDAGIIPHDIKANIAAGAVKAQDTANAISDTATDATLVAIRDQFALATFDATSGLVTSGLAPTLNTGGVSVKNAVANTVDPASDEAVYLWSRMVKMMESKATADVNRMKRVAVDSFGTDNVTGIGPSTSVGISGGIVPLVTIANDFSANLTGLFTSTSVVGYNNQMYQDVARNAYARNIRPNLEFS